MADKQLTVAELMARAQKENPDAQPRRRRRRSLDEGGVSVAELTGSLKTVDARPAEVKHSSVPIDSDAEPAAPAKTAQPAKPEPAKTEQPAKPEPAKTEKVTGTKVEAEKTPQPKEPVKPVAEAKPEAQTETKAETKPEPVKASSVKGTVNDSKAVKSDQAANVPEPQKRDETLTRSSFKAVAPQPSKTEETGPISRVVAFGDRPAAGTEATVEEPAGEKEDVDKPASFREPEAADAEVTQESPVVRDEHLPEEPVYRHEEQEEIEVDNSVNPIMLVLLVFAGLVVGVLMFLGFQYLWASLNPFVAGVLALAVTGGIVLLVRAMKTGRDALTMTLAALAGAAMTFGPALVTAF